MIAREITYDQLKEAIKIAFQGDIDIFKYYDPAIKVESVDQIVDDVSKKISDYEKFKMFGVYEKNNLVGYFVSRGGLLVSFALSMPYRNRKYKRVFFSLIKDHFKGLFMCFLWTNNQRAVGFLKKCGMRVLESNHLITQLGL